MTITISNESASVFVRGYAHTENGLLVWLEIADERSLFASTPMLTAQGCALRPPSGPRSSTATAPTCSSRTAIKVWARWSTA